MHLLRRDSNGKFSLVEFHGQPPPYAILSHTWGSDNDEVTFKDIVKGRGKEKLGYVKLHFCAGKAADDGLEYFWVTLGRSPSLVHWLILIRWIRVASIREIA